MISSTEKSLGLTGSTYHAQRAIRSDLRLLGALLQGVGFRIPKEGQSYAGNGVCRISTGTHQCRFSVFPELILLGTLGYIFAWLEGPCLTPVVDCNEPVGMPDKALTSRRMST